VKLTIISQPISALVLAAIALVGCGPVAQVTPAASLSASQPAAEVPAAAVAQTGPRTIKWEEIDLPLGSDAKFQPWMLTTALKALDGRTVRIAGYMYGDVFQPNNIREFKLVRHVDCEFGAVGHPAHLIFIELEDKLRTSFTTEPVTVEGTFHIQPFSGPDGRTWALYHMDVTKIERGES
jgi:hypothetical protein